MLRLALIAALAVAGIALTPPFASRARAEVVVHIDKSAQRMSVLVDGAEKYAWPVSTGVGGGPPSGTYRPQRFERSWHSRKYDWAPMPYSIFFHEGYAIHGTVHVSRLGNRASKGCVRLHPDNAATLFSLVQKSGNGSTRIVVASAGVTTGVNAVSASKPATEPAAKPRRESAAPPSPAAVKDTAPPAKQQETPAPEETGSISAPEIAGTAMEKLASGPKPESKAPAVRKRAAAKVKRRAPPPEDDDDD